MYIILIFAGCRQSTRDGTSVFRRVEDMTGRMVKIPDKIDKVIGLRAGALRMLVYMDAVEMIAGIEEGEQHGARPYTLAFPGLLELPVIGPAMGGDAELILKSGADVIFLSYTSGGDADALQKKTGIPVIAIECPEFATEREKLYQTFKLIGQVLRKEARADSLINYIEESINILNKRTGDIAGDNKHGVYIGGISYSGAHGINSTQPYYPPFHFVNALNYASTVNKRLISHVKGTYIDIEQLILWDPEILFIDESGINLVKQDLAQNRVLYHSLDAVKNNRIHVLLPYNNYATNYEFVLVNAWYTGMVVYPERFSDIEIQSKIKEITTHFLGRDIVSVLKSGYIAPKQMSKEEL